MTVVENPVEPVVENLPDYADFDRPTVQRQAVGHDIAEPEENLEVLDIPAFLRRQVD